MSNKRFTSTTRTSIERPAKPSVLQQHQNVAYVADDAIIAASSINQETLGREDRNEHEGIKDKGLLTFCLKRQLKVLSLIRPFVV